MEVIRLPPGSCVCLVVVEGRLLQCYYRAYWNGREQLTMMHLNRRVLVMTDHSMRSPNCIDRSP